MAIRVFHRDRPDLMLPMIARDARLVVWPGVGAQMANMNYVDMQPGEENVAHTHEESEDAIVILDGEGTIDDLMSGVSHRFHTGQVVFVPVGVPHRVRADRGSRLESVGGPCPPDKNLLRAIGV